MTRITPSSIHHPVLPCSIADSSYASLSSPQEDARNAFEHLREAIDYQAWDQVRHLGYELLQIHHRQHQQQVLVLKNYDLFTRNRIDVEDQLDIIRHLLSTMGVQQDDQEVSVPNDILPMLFECLDVSSYLPFLFSTSTDTSSRTMEPMCRNGFYSACNNHYHHHDLRKNHFINCSSNKNSSHNYSNSTSLIFPSSFTMSSSSSSFSSKSFPNMGYKGTSLLNELCIDGNCTGLQTILNALPNHVASNEVQRADSMFTEYMVQEREISNANNIASPITTTSMYEFQLFHSPFQALWEGILFHKDEYQIFNSIRLGQMGNDDVKHQLTNIERIWNMTQVLLQQVNRSTICIDNNNINKESNMIHTIVHLGHKVHSAVLWLALQLQQQQPKQQDTRLDLIKDSHGNLPIHIAAMNLIYYKSIPSQQQSTTTMCSEWDLPPVVHLLTTSTTTASMTDAMGRLPLHIVLSNHNENQKRMDDIGSVFDHHYDEGEQEEDHDDSTSLSSNRNGYAMDTLMVVQELIKANPYSPKCMDPITGLYPFFTAITSESVSLDIAYLLLTQNLDVLSDQFYDEDDDELENDRVLFTNDDVMDYENYEDEADYDDEVMKQFEYDDCVSLSSSFGSQSPKKAQHDSIYVYPIDIHMLINERW